MDTTDSRARAGVVGSGTGSGATLSRVVPTLVQKGTAPLQTHEHAIAAAASGALLGVSLLGARFPRLVAWPLTAVGAFLGGLGLLRAVQSTLSDREQDPESHRSEGWTSWKGTKVEVRRKRKCWWPLQPKRRCGCR